MSTFALDGGRLDTGPMGGAQMGQRVVLLTKLKRTTMRSGSVTQAFFRKGEELEATGFENVPPDDPTLVPPKLEFRSFDRVPRRWAPLLVTVFSLAVVALGVLEWRSIREAPGGPAAVARSVRTTAVRDWARLEAFVKAHAEPARAGARGSSLGGL